MSATPQPLASWLMDTRARVEHALRQALSDDVTIPAALAEAMRYSVLAGGKRLRPLLVLAAAEACASRASLDPDQATAHALPVACAIELIHTYSLVHDDLPSMDDDTLRRGRPTAHVVFGEAMAILSGDALLTEAFALLSRAPLGARGPEDAAAARRLEVVRVLATAAGPGGMVGGQVLDLQAVAPGANPLNPESLRAMHARKTGALIRGAVLSGAILGGADEEAMTAMDVYGESIGLAFQIVDDILDVEGASATLGKTAGKDAAAGKPTYPAVYGLDQSRSLAASSIARALAAIEGAEIAGQLPAIARWVASRTH